MSYTMEYDEYTGKWNIIDMDTHEWIFEGTYEQCDSMMEAHFQAYCEEQDELYDNDYPNDYYGD